MLIQSTFFISKYLRLSWNIIEYADIGRNKSKFNIKLEIKILRI